MRELIEKDKMIRTIRRISHEIIERNGNLSNIILLGIKKNGTPMAHMIQENIKNIEGIIVPTYELDITGYRDDIIAEITNKLTISLESKNVIVVDDVLFTGRTVRASMDAIMDLGRPQKVQLAVLVDRGHRELPIRADYVGRNIPTSMRESVKVNFTDNVGVYILNKEEN